MKTSPVTFAFLGLLIGVGATLSVVTYAAPKIDQKSSGGTLNSSKPPKTVGPILLTLTADKRVYGVGDPIAVTLTAANKSAAPIPLTFTSTKKFDIAIYRVKGTGKNAVSEKEPVWQLSHGRMYGMIIMMDSLGLDKPFAFSQTIDPTKFAPGAKLDAGAYRLEGFLTPSQSQFAQPTLDASVDFTVK